MIKTLFITLIKGYQMIVSPILHQLLGLQSVCRYPVTCSEYAKLSISRHGVIRGGMMAVKRLMSCQPLGQLTINNLQLTKKS